jgi:predicted TIM-barrel fold metal-dependent hydrolase
MKLTNHFHTEDSHVFVGDHSSIKGNYLVDDYLRDVAQIPPDRIHFSPRLQLVGSVHVEAAADHPLNEVLWIQHLSDTQHLRTGQRGFPQAIAAHAVLTLPEEELRCLFTEYTTCFSNVRGIRQILNFHPSNPHYQLVPNEYLTNPQWERGLSLLSKFNLHFELHIFATQIPFALQVCFFSVFCSDLIFV